ncbi:hypothetical protein IWW52_004814, partial [Coemansia sp. RSA 2704]
MSAMTDGAGEQRIYELEAAAAQLRAANAQSQRTAERLERDHQRTLDELATLRSAHERLETRFFETESELAAAAARLERTQRANAALEADAGRQAAAGERERDAWQRAEADLRAELAAAKRRAAVGRRQTVSAASPPMHARTKSMYAHDAALDEPEPLQAQIRQLTRRLREADARAQDAAALAQRAQADAEQALGALDASQQQAAQLEHTAQQLRELNEALREDNESYQMLLQMSTIKGGLSFNARTSVDSRASSGKWAASPTIHEDSPQPQPAALDLASELGHVLTPDADALPARVAELEEQVTQLKEELRQTKYGRRLLAEENKAMGLYVNKILSRILASAGGLEAVLSHDYDPAAAPAPEPQPTPKPRPRHARHSSLRLVRKPPAEPAKQEQQQQPPPSLALFAEPGSGDGITSVFVPPLPSSPSPSSLSPPPPVSRRARSATV